MSLFCRHNRFTADCPICSKGTVLEEAGPRRRAPAKRAGAPARSRPAPDFTGPHVSAGPWQDEEGSGYVVRLERVPGGVRLAEWSGARLRRRAPVLSADALLELAAGAGTALAARDAAALAGAIETPPAEDRTGAAGVSAGRSGDFKEELRVEPLDGDRVRVGRWVLRPAQGWQLQDAPTMLPAGRYAEAIAGAVRSGLLPAPGSG